MTTHIENAVTEVIAEPESTASTGGGGSDPRWSEQRKICDAIKQAERMRQRVGAEGFDD